IETVKRIKEIHPRIRTIIMTGYASEDAPVRAITVGVDDYIFKPFEDEIFIHSIQQNLQYYRMEQLKTFISPQVVELIMNGKMNYDFTPHRVELTILFSDIRGFTRLSDELEAEELVIILNEYLTEMTKIIFQHNGTIDKYLGDGIMAFFGAPIADEKHPRNAVRAALSMQGKFGELAGKWLGDAQRELGAGIGINTGYVTVGSFGPEIRKDYTVIGKNVNLAARLEGLAETGQILISPRTYSHVKDLFEIESLGQQQMMGRTTPMSVYNVNVV
ncbi:response regulator, partial [bacterium]|nr:response regulator [bacterium]